MIMIIVIIFYQISDKKFKVHKRSYVVISRINRSVIAIVFSLVSQINFSNGVNISFNTVYAEDIEVITITGTNYKKVMQGLLGGAHANAKIVLEIDGIGLLSAIALFDPYGPIGECEWQEFLIPKNCNRFVKPDISPNGCSVPGSLQGFYSTAMTRFNGVCNRHDVCYSTFGAIKYECDEKFMDDLDLVCDSLSSAFSYARCASDALDFSVALRVPIISQSKFDQAQSDSDCVHFHNFRDSTGCRP